MPMKLVGKLKEKVEKAETKEKAKELIANAGMELTDEEMDKVSGGESINYHYMTKEGCNQQAGSNNVQNHVECNRPVEKLSAVIGKDVL